ncbi:hypothetical protein ACP70R_025538 [Stipagrostis hirtigluma subsp. patula]
MSSPKRRRVSPCDWTTTADSPPPSIPDDLLLEIFARFADATTIVRCAATSKPIRRAVLDPEFLRRRAMASGNGGRLDPAFLVGVSYAFCEKNSPDPAVVSAPRRRRSLRFDARLLHSFVPVASRGGLVVLRQREGDRSASARLLVCNSLTGHRLYLPPATIAAKYPHALLAADDVCFSFQLLVMDRSLRTQIFSPEHGKWGAVVQAHLPPQFSASLVDKASGRPVVLGRTVVHWLCSDRGILALNVGTARATLIDLPPNCLCRVTDAQKREVVDKGLLLAASADGRLSLLVAEYLTMCMWTMSPAGSSSTPAARWTRRVVIRRDAIDRNGPGWVVRFLAFGERSGTVILQMREVGLVEINLGTREARVLSRDFKEIKDLGFFQLCLHETDLSTLIRTMKPF